MLLTSLVFLKTDVKCYLQHQFFKKPMLKNVEVGDI